MLQEGSSGAPSDRRSARLRHERTKEERNWPVLFKLHAMHNSGRDGCLWGSEGQSSGEAVVVGSRVLRRGGVRPALVLRALGLADPDVPVRASGTFSRIFCSTSNLHPAAL